MELDKSDIVKYLQASKDNIIILTMIFISSIIIDIYAIITFKSTKDLVIFLISMCVSCLIKIVSYCSIRKAISCISCIKNKDYECTEGIIQDIHEEFNGYSIKIQGMDSNIHARSLIGHIKEGDTVKAIKFKNSNVYDIIG